MAEGPEPPLAVPAPYVAQDVQEVAEMLRALDVARKDKKQAGFTCKRSEFKVADSPDDIRVDSWKMQDWDYKRPNLPTYARGLFTTRTRHNEPEIAIRGYDKFFNVGEVNETKWENILTNTRGPYELTLKENGCIIFISGLEDGTLLVCSKHSTGDRGDTEVSHARAGEDRIDRQLAKLGKTREDLARELRSRNATAVAELCDDDFEEHILAYRGDQAGLYLHGINLNLPTFATYPSQLVQSFARDWGFLSVGLIVMDDINEVKSFLEGVAETGAHSGRDVEGFVIRCQMSLQPGSAPFQDWFFKYKFEEPYLMYRQWRECTKAMITGKQPRYKKHIKITEEYLLFARQRLAQDRSLAKLYQQNHGIIALRDEFLQFKNLNGADAANLELQGNLDIKTEVTKDVILCPVATIGCGKTTIAVALGHLFNWGHVQNDNIQGKGRPPRFTRAVLDQLEDHPVVIADRNNAQKHERKQIITDVKLQHKSARLVALNFRHDADKVDEIRKVTQERVLARGDGHQTIHAFSDPSKFLGVMEGFIARFEPVTSFSPPDDGFDIVIDLDPVAGSRANLEIIITELKRVYPNLLPGVPTSEELDDAIKYAMDEYKPDLRHNIPERGRKKQGQREQPPPGPKRKKPLEYMSVNVPEKEITALLEKTFRGTDPPVSRFYLQLKGTRRVQPAFHVTLMHRTKARDYPELWERYTRAQAEAEAETGLPEAKLGDCGVMLERVVWDERIMAMVVRLIDEEGKWECVNKVAHITIGTRDDSVKPKESNDLLQRWLEEGTGNDTKIQEIAFDGRPTLDGIVRGVLSR